VVYLILSILHNIYLAFDIFPVIQSMPHHLSVKNYFKTFNVIITCFIISNTQLHITLTQSISQQEYIPPIQIKLRAATPPWRMRYSSPSAFPM